MTTTELIILIIVAVLLLLAMKFGKSRGKDTRATQLMKRYATMTRELINTAPDGELVDGVVSHVLALAADSRRPDPVAVLATLPHAYTVVYTVWVVCKEMAVGGYAAMMKTGARSLADTVSTCFEQVEAVQCAAAFAALHAATDDITGLEQALRLAIQTECPLSLCEEYIRDNADECLDEQITRIRIHHIYIRLRFVFILLLPARLWWPG